MRWTLPLLVALAGCTGSGSGPAERASAGEPARGREAATAGRGARPAPAAAATRSAADVADARDVGIRSLTPQDTESFAKAWRLFVTHDPRWEVERETWLERGGAAPYILSENLFRYFWSASRANRVDEVLRVGANAQRVGEPAVAYFGKALVTDRWPLDQPITTEVFNPDDITRPIKKTFTHYDIDDTTRQHAARVLANVGPPAVPFLTSPTVQRSELRSARVYGTYALGVIATDQAVASLGRTVTEDADWQVRGAAAKALGFALRKNPAARAPLERATADPDAFVQKKAKEALAGKTRLEF